MLSDTFPAIASEQQLAQRIQNAAAIAVWFTGPDCRLCSDLRPKLAALLTQRFPRLETALVDCAGQPRAAARHQVFSVPTLLVFFSGREALRKVRHMSLPQLAAELDRPYHLLFD